MEFLRHLVVLVHLVGFAVIFGAWVVEAVSRRRQATSLMNWGLLIAGVAGLILAAPWPAGVELNYAKIGVKLMILLAIGAVLGIARARQRRTDATPPALFWSIGVLTFANAAIAVLW